MPGGSFPPPATSSGGRRVTRHAQPRVLALESLRVESRAVGVEAAPPGGRVTGEAIALGVAGDAALQALARRLAVPQREGLLGVVEASLQPRRGHDTGLPMAILTERLGVVAIRAGALASIRLGRVAREEAGRVVTPDAGGGIGPVTVETVVPRVTGRAALRASRSEGAVT